MKWLKITEYTAWLVGFALVGFYFLSRSQSSAARADDLQRFSEAKASLAKSSNSDGASPATGPAEASSTSTPQSGKSFDQLPDTSAFDFTLWAEGRIKKYRETLAMDLGVPMAILRVPKLQLEVPVLEGTSDAVLDRAVGRIEGTVQPGQAGNAGIAGHRDGVFRGLKDLQVGDWLEVETLAGIYSYQIDTITIVSPNQVDLLESSPEAMLTLVTCYPFYFVGKAPERYVVRALFKDPAGDRIASADTAVSVDQAETRD